MRTFLRVFWSIILSISLAAFFFYVSLWLAWGRIIEVSTGANLSIFIMIVLYIWEFRRLVKKEGLKKVLISNAIIFAFLIPISYLYLFKDNSKLYSYANYPCKNEIVTSDRNIVMIEYAGTSMNLFDKITKYNLEDEKHYNVIKKTTGHTYIKTYPVGSKWKVLGLYVHTRYNLNYFLLSSLNDNEKAWVYTDNFNYKQCKIEALDREVPFERYLAVGSRKLIEF